MCNIRIHPRKWGPEKRVMDGQFDITTACRDRELRRYLLAVHTDLSSWFGIERKPDTPQGLLHYLVLEIAEKRLLGFLFGIDFTRRTGDELAAELGTALRRHSTQLEGIVGDVGDVLSTLEQALRELCIQLPREETLRQWQARRPGDDFPEIVHSPALIPEGYDRVVELSNSLRDRDNNRAA